MIRLKNYWCHNIFNKKNIHTFYVLTFIQMCRVLTDKKFTSGNNHTYKKVSEWGKNICAKVDKQ